MRRRAYKSTHVAVEARTSSAPHLWISTRLLMQIAVNWICLIKFLCWVGQRQREHNNNSKREQTIKWTEEEQMHTSLRLYVRRFVVHLAAWLVGRLAGWLDEWLVGWLVGRLTDLLNFWLLDWLTEWLMHSCIDIHTEEATNKQRKKQKCKNCAAQLRCSFHFHPQGDKRTNMTARISGPTYLLLINIYYYILHLCTHICMCRQICVYTWHILVYYLRSSLRSALLPLGNWILFIGAFSNDGSPVAACKLNVNKKSPSPYLSDVQSAFRRIVGSVVCAAGSSLINFNVNICPELDWRRVRWGE